MIEEQREKALNRLDWHYVDEIVRPNTLNCLFEKEINSMKNLPGLGKNKDSNRDAYVCNLKAYLPIAEARYIDVAVRTVITHILDVPKDDRMTRVASEDAPQYSFDAPQIFDDEDMDGLMKIRDDLSARRETQVARVSVLKELQEVLKAMPDATNDDHAGESGFEGGSGDRHAPQGVNGFPMAEAELDEDVNAELESGAFNTPSFLNRMAKLTTTSPPPQRY